MLPICPSCSRTMQADEALDTIPLSCPNCGREVHAPDGPELSSNPREILRRLQGQEGRSLGIRARRKAVGEALAMMSESERTAYLKEQKKKALEAYRKDPAAPFNEGCIAFLWATIKAAACVLLAVLAARIMLAALFGLLVKLGLCSAPPTWADFH